MGPDKLLSDRDENQEQVMAQPEDENQYYNNQIEVQDEDESHGSDGSQPEGDDSQKKDQCELDTHDNVQIQQDDFSDDNSSKPSTAPSLAPSRGGMSRGHGRGSFLGRGNHSGRLTSNSRGDNQVPSPYLSEYSWYRVSTNLPERH